MTGKIDGGEPMKVPNYTHEQLQEKQIQFLKEEKYKASYFSINDKIAEFILKEARANGLSHAEACELVYVDALRWIKGA